MIEPLTFPITAIWEWNLATTSLDRYRRIYGLSKDRTPPYAPNPHPSPNKNA